VARAAPVSSRTSAPPARVAPTAPKPSKALKTPHKSTESAHGWGEKSGFASAETLAGLLDPVRPAGKRRR
jgi:hypothetical protein